MPEIFARAASSLVCRQNRLGRRREMDLLPKNFPASAARAMAFDASRIRSISGLLSPGDRELNRASHFSRVKGPSPLLFAVAACNQIFHCGLKWSAAFFAIQDAKPSLSQRSFCERHRSPGRRTIDGQFCELSPKKFSAWWIRNWSPGHIATFPRHRRFHPNFPSPSPASDGKAI